MRVHHVRRVEVDHEGGNGYVQAERSRPSPDGSSQCLLALDRTERYLPSLKGRSANRRMRARMSGGVGEAGVSPVSTRFGAPSLLANLQGFAHGY